jgi:hypothetical protein
LFSDVTIPGAANVTTIKTTDEHGRPLHTQIETRIESQAGNSQPQPQTIVHVTPAEGSLSAWMVSTARLMLFFDGQWPNIPTA